MIPGTLTMLERLRRSAQSNPDYLAALATGYLLTATSMLVQFALTPLYLRYLGKSEFGQLMMVLNVINLAAIGVGWLSGGLQRVFGEAWSRGDLERLRAAYSLGKHLYSSYALVIAIVGVLLWWIYQLDTRAEGMAPGLLVALIYLLLHYEYNSDRLAYIATCRQKIGNLLDLTSLVTAACFIFLMVPRYPDIATVLVGLCFGVIVQRAFSAKYWRHHEPHFRWSQPWNQLRPLLFRLLGRQGVRYASYGALLLGLQADALLVGYLGGPQAAAKFVLLWKIPEALALLLWRIPSSLEPHVIRLDAAGEHRKLITLFLLGRKRFAVAAAIPAIGYMLLGPWITRMWVGEHAPSEQWMFIIGGLALFLSAFARWPVSFAFALVRLRSLIRVTAIELVLKFAVTILFFPALNFVAPVLASVVAQVFFAAWAYQRLVLQELRV